MPGWPNQDPYPPSSHPLELGEDALRALFGFVTEGYPDPNDVDAEAVHQQGFRVTDPTGQEQAARQAAYEDARRTMGPPQLYRMGPDGAAHEISFDDL